MTSPRSVERVCITNECRMLSAECRTIQRPVFCILHSAFCIRLESRAMKKFAVLVLILFACSRREDGRLKPAAPQHPVMKVGLLTPGSVNDNGWNAIAYEGLQRIHRKFGATIAHQQTSNPAEMDEGVRSYAAKGFDPSSGHAFESMDAPIAARTR